MVSHDPGPKLRPNHRIELSGGVPGDYLPYDVETYRRLKEIGARYRREDKYKKSSKEYRFWERNNWDELRKEFLTKRANGSLLYPTVSTFIEAKWTDPDERHYAKLIIGPRPKKKVPWEGFFAMERHAEAWDREQKVQGRMDELEAELDEFRAFAVLLRRRKLLVSS
jgi:hypothetical protein